MPTRLVLGCADDCRVLVERLAEAGDLLVVVADETDREWLTERGIRVEIADPTDPDALAALEADVDSVVVATGDPDQNGRAVAAARTAFPSAAILAEGTGGAPTDADRTVDGSSAIAERVLGHVGSTGGQRALGLRRALKSVEGRVAVVMHDNPDPDAIASAIGVVELAQALGVDADPCYFGEIAHQENRALVNLLDLQLRELEDPSDLGEYDAIALVDHARPGVNDQLPTEVAIDVVVDHHPPRGPVEGEFVDLHEDVGATSTIVVDYFERLGVELSTTVATALLYGIRVDTDDFTREVSTADFEAASTLVPIADESVLERVESPSVSADTLEVIASAIDRRQVHGSILTACVGEVGDRDALAQAADQLLDMEGISTAMVFGIVDETVYVSARVRGSELDLGEVLRNAFDRIGSAGGHDEMAGAQIPVGMLVEPEEDDVVGIVEEVLTREFLEAVELPAPARYRTSPAEGIGLTEPVLSVDEGAGGSDEEPDGDDGG